ncbi:MAG: thioredoxin domain-containing protein [Deltaproteobacteria bacterium]|nr:thioredoxin domain-containing protein [Deltaproteobacteria bacterium]
MRRRLCLSPLLLLASLACQPSGATKAPSEPAADTSRVQDARDLPSFGPGDDDAKSSTEIERYYVPLADAPARGPTNAAVTVVMFSDFECPFCEKGHQIMGELQRRYGGAVRVAYKAFPLDMHPHALLAAMAARTAQAQGKFWNFHDRLFSQKGLDTDTLFAHANAANLDVDILRRDLETLAHAPAVSRDLRLGRRLGVSSTPTFFINGRLVTGAKPLRDFEAIIEDELTRVEQWRKDGLDPEQTYAHAIADGYRKVVFTDDNRLDADAVVPVPLGTSPRRGPDDAPITIVAFGDFECPYCAKGTDTVESLREHYGQQIRVVHKHSPLPFHSHAYVAARAAVAAHAQGKFWAFHDALYARRARFDEDDLVEVAKEAGLNMKKFRKAMDNIETDAAIEKDTSLAMSLGVTGTPAYFINGRPVQGAQPELVFRIVIAEELERAAAAKERGVSGADLYEALTHSPLDDVPQS